MIRKLSAALLTLTLAAGFTASAPAFAGHGHSSSCKHDSHGSSKGKGHHSGHQRPDSVRYGEVSVQNRTGETLSLYANGDFVANIGPGWQSLALPFGDYKLRLERHGRKVATLRTTVSRSNEPIWRVDTPTSGRLVIKNPLPVDIYVNGPGVKDQRVPAGSKAVFDNLDVGLNLFRVRTLSGRQLDSIRVDIDPWEKSKRQVKAPSTGYVMVDNREGLNLGVYVNGRRVGQVGAYSRLPVELALGNARVDLVDERGRYNHTLSSEMVYVQAWDDAVVRLDIAGHQRPSTHSSVRVPQHSSGVHTVAYTSAGSAYAHASTSHTSATSSSSVSVHVRR